MNKLLPKLIKDFPDLSFRQGNSFSYSPKDRTIFFMIDSGNDNDRHNWSLLHELGHAILKHNSYTTDIELLKMESEAWHKAKQIGAKYGYDINEDHIQDCIDTYRDWLHQRSTCPNCSTHSVQTDSKTYKCFNCSQSWSVTSSRFCRPYRLKKASNKKSLQVSNHRATS